MNSLGILQTLKYSDHFDYPLTLKELHQRLIKVHTTQQELVSQISQLLKQKRLEQTGEYYHLPKRASLVSHRTRRALNAAPLLNRAHTLAARLSVVPGVLAIYLTGSLAMKNSQGDADIDWMIITRPHRLWTTRLLLTLYTELIGLRRRPGSPHAPGKLCLNLYLTPNSYLLIPKKRSLYTAYELIQAVPLYDPHNTRASLLAANPWITHFLPNYPLPPASTKNHPLQSGKWFFWNWLESLCYHLQLAYMHHKITREYIAEDAAFFHPHDPSPKVK